MSRATRIRHVIAAALVVLALGSTAVACGGDSDKVSSGSKQSSSDTSAESYVGLTLQNADTISGYEPTRPAWMPVTS